MSCDEVRDVFRLPFAQQGDDPHRSLPFVASDKSVAWIVTEVDHRFDESFGLRLIDVVVVLEAVLDVDRLNRRVEYLLWRRAAQRFEPAAVTRRQVIVEFDDRRHTPKVFGQQDSIYLRDRAGDLIEAVIYVEALGVRNVRQKLAVQLVNLLFLNPDVGRADLFGVTDYQDLFPPIQHGQSAQIALAGLVHDDYVEGGGFRLEGLDDPEERHDPDRDRAHRLDHRPVGRREMALGVPRCHFSELPHGVGPGRQGHVLAVFDVGDLSLPGSLCDELSDQFALRFPHPFEAILKALHALALVKTNQPLIQSPPSPRQHPILRHRPDAGLRGLAFDLGRPFGRHALKPLQQMINPHHTWAEAREPRRFFIRLLVIFAGTLFDRGGQLRPERVRILLFSLAVELLLELSQVIGQSLLVYRPHLSLQCLQVFT